MENKPFAPYGAILHLIQAQQIKLKTHLYFFCGKDAQIEAKKFYEGGQLALCLPLGQRFENYKWPLIGLRIILYDTGKMSSLGLSKLAYSILKEGADLVAVYSEQNIGTEVYQLKKELLNGKGNAK